jgi:hypothetical protein
MINPLVMISCHYAWKGLADYVKEFISCCAKCQKFLKIKTQAPILKPITVSSPWELVGMYLIGPFKKIEISKTHCQKSKKIEL